MRTHLVLGLLTVLLLVIVISNRHDEPFTYDSVVAMAEEMAREGYLSAVAALPLPLRELNYDQVRDIRWKDELTLWRKEGLPFQARFFHPGGLHGRAVEIFQIADNSVEPLRYSPEFFDFGKNRLTGLLPQTVGYAGFRIHHPLNKPDVLDEVMAFLGASYFRAVAKNLHYGISARGLAINTSVKDKEEEFPVFTKFWLKRPDRFANNMSIFALLESKSVVGAYQFDVWPGPETHMVVKATLFFTKIPQSVGFAPLTSMFWYGENTSNTFGDFRPEVHDSDGLLMQRSNGEWVWHALSWSQQKQHSVFGDNQPKGYGLMQRDREFPHYQDLEAKYHERPSLWVQPISGFDAGAVHLVQLPTKDEFLDNVVAFWSPEKPPEPLKPVRLEYLLRWLGDSPDLPPLGRAISTRVDDQDKPYYRHFFVEFAGGPLQGLKPGEIPEVDTTSVTGANITDTKIEWNGFNSSWRVSFYASTPESRKPNEFTCRLKWQGEPLTETWSYTWMP
jgi:glucans biosynthesis protein